MSLRSDDPMTQTREQHLQEWDDTLQDWLNGELAPAARARFAAHLESCEICSDQVAGFERVDEALTQALPRLTLDNAFERRLFSKIDAIDEHARAAKRRQAERELEAERRLLARTWRRSVLTVVPSVIAGIVLAVSLSSYFSGSELVGSLVADGAAALGRNTAGMLHLGVTSLIGAGVGLTIARWLTRTS
jgi:anti-sigma factor RsiW